MTSDRVDTNSASSSGDPRSASSVQRGPSAGDIALWDINGKALGVPVYELLGGLVRDRLVCYPHNVGHANDTDSLVESCLAAKEAGWKFVRWGSPDNDGMPEPLQVIRTSVQQFEAIRTAVGEDIELVSDVHTRLDLPDALRLCLETEPYRPFFIEDPLHAENSDSFKTLRPRTTVPIAAGEQFTSKWQSRQLI